jgi:hypothetical protein
VVVTHETQENMIIEVTPYNSGNFIPGNSIAQSQLLISGNNFQKKVITNKDGIYSIDIPKSGFYTIQLLKTSPSNPISSKKILIEKKFPLVTANFNLPASSSSNKSFTLQDAGYPDCEEPTGCNSLDKFCGSNNNILYICFDAAHDNQLCTKEVSTCGFGLTCSNGACKCPTGTIWDPTSGSCIDEQQTCDPNTCIGCTQSACTSSPKCRWNGYSCQQRCGGPGELCCSESSCGPNLQCNSINRCEACGLQGQKCCSSSPSCGPGLTCGAGNVCSITVTYKVSGIIFLDTNNNGIRDNQETLFTLPATVTAGSGGSTTTSNGVYEIVLPNSGSYQIKLVNLPPGYNPAYNPTPGIAVDQYSPTATVNLGVAPQAEYKVQGTVFIDTNKNGKKDTNEIGSGNENISIAFSNQTMSAVTNTNGSYTKVLQTPGYYSVTLNTKQNYDNTSPEIVDFYIDASNPTKTIDFGIYPKATITPSVKFTKPATDGITVSGIIEMQAVASASGAIFNGFSICSDVPNDQCYEASTASLANNANFAVNIPGGLNTLNYSNGNHTFTATATTGNGNKIEAKRTIKIQNNTPTPTKTSTTPPTATPVKTVTPVPTSSKMTATPTPTSTSKIISPTVTLSVSPGQTSTPTPSPTPTPGSCNNNKFCEFGENVNTCPADCPVRCGDNICSAEENHFSCAADCQAEPTMTPTPTGINITNTSTPTVTLPIGITSTLTPSPTPGPTDTILNISIQLPGIGNKSGDNTTPINKTIPVTIALYNNSHQFVKQATGELTFDGQTFKGTVNVGTLPSGTYSGYIKTKNSLIKQLSTPVSGSGVIIIPPDELITGDFDQTNKLDIVDYNQLLGCYGKKQDGSSFQTQAVFTCSAQDLNDDGKIDEKDVNIFLRGFAIREGDKP